MRKSGIYIHIPFCISKCRYCDFNSGVYDDSVHKRYFHALKKEIIMSCAGSAVMADTVYIGGGTPSSVDPGYITELMETLRCSAEITADAEISIEVNPGTLDERKACVYRSAGVNRVSMGLQSADDGVLRVLGRAHSSDDFESSYGILRAAGFENINIDLMYAVPGQSRDSFADTVAYAVSMNPEHISAYSLIIEPGTPFGDALARGDIGLCDDSEDRMMFGMCRDMLKEAGYERYEISNFSRDGYECAHNIKYWKRADYVGFGLGAHSFRGGVRWYNSADIDEYIRTGGQCVSGRETISGEEAASEYLMLGLRMAEGISVNEYEKLSGRRLADNDDTVTALITNGFAVLDEDCFRLTDRGMDVMNSVLIELGV